MTRAGSLGIESNTLGIGHQQTGEMPEEMAALSVETYNWAAGFGIGNYKNIPNCRIQQESRKYLKPYGSQEDFPTKNSKNS